MVEFADTSWKFSGSRFPLKFWEIIIYASWKIIILFIEILENNCMCFLEIFRKIIVHSIQIQIICGNNVFIPRLHVEIEASWK